MIGIQEKVREKLCHVFGGKGYIYYVKKKVPFQSAGNILDFFAMGSFSSLFHGKDDGIHRYLIGSESKRLYVELCFGEIISEKDVTALICPPDETSWKMDGDVYSIYPKKPL